MSYNGYVGISKKKSAENIMQQISLAQTEYYSDNGYYITEKHWWDVIQQVTTSSEIETNLLGGQTMIVSTSEMGYEFCVSNDATNYKVFAKNYMVVIVKLNYSAKWYFRKN